MQHFGPPLWGASFYPSPVQGAQALSFQSISQDPKTFTGFCILSLQPNEYLPRLCTVEQIEQDGLKLPPCRTCPNLVHSQGKCRLESPAAKRGIESLFPISWMNYLITEQSKRSRSEVCASLNPVDILWEYLPNETWKQRWFADMSGTKQRTKTLWVVPKQRHFCMCFLELYSENTYKQRVIGVR